MGVTVSQVQALQQRYPDLYSQVRDKVITKIEITSQGAKVAYMEKGEYFEAERQSRQTQQTAPTQQTQPQGTPAPFLTLDPFSQKAFKRMYETRQMQADPIGYTVPKVVEIGAAATGLGAPALAIKGALIGLGISQGIVGVMEQRPLTPQEAREAAMGGAAFSGVGSTVFQATGVSAIQGVKGVAVRAAVSAGLVGGAGYVVSGGKPEAAMYGAALGAGLSIGGEVVSYAYPRYIKPGLSKAYQKVFPERSMYGRVVASQQSKLTMGELYQRSVLNAQPKGVTAPKVISPKDVGITHTSPSSFAQQKLILKQPVQKVGMKPWVLSTTKTLTKETAVSAYALTRTLTPETKTETKQQSKTQQKQKTKQQQKETAYPVQYNPFTQYSGAPFYGQPEREDIIYVVYPKTSPLSSPQIISNVTPIQAARTTPIQSSDILQESSQSLRNILGQSQVYGVSQAQAQGLTQKQIQEQVQELTQVQQQQQRQTPRYWNLGGFDAPQGFARISNDVFGRYGRYKRKYPLMTAKQMLKLVFE